MKRMKEISAFLLVLLMSIGLMAVSVSAETMSQDGLQITLTADKESYSQTDPVTATLTVKNTNNFAVTNVSLETMIPEGYKLDGNSEATAKIDSDDWNKRMDDVGKRHNKAFESGNLENNIKAVLDKYGFDGIFFDYEYPIKSKYWKAFSNFIVSLDLLLF